MTFTNFCVGIAIVYSTYYVVMIGRDYYIATKKKVSSSNEDEYEVSGDEEVISLDESPGIPILNAHSVFENEEKEKEKFRQQDLEQKIKEEVEKLQQKEKNRQENLAPTPRTEQPHTNNIPQNLLEDDIFLNNKENINTSKKITNITHYGGLSMAQLASSLKGTANIFGEVASKY